MPQAPQNSLYRRAKSDIWLAIPPTHKRLRTGGYYEQQPDIRQTIHNHYDDINERCMVRILELIDKRRLRTDIDLKIMYRKSIMAAEGYMFQKYYTGIIEPDEIEKDFTILIEHWRTIYCI